MQMDPNKLLESLGIGLSRLLRYSYGGFLLIAFIFTMNSAWAKVIRDAMSWPLMAITAAVLGAGIYSIHRLVVVPIHHAILCLIWWGLSNCKCLSLPILPISYLGTLGVPWWLQIPAYTVLRRSDVFTEKEEEGEREEWNLAHAESGMVLMTAEAFFIAGVWAKCQPDRSSSWLFLIGSVLLVFSFFGCWQHVVECLLFKKNEKEVKEELEKLGFI
jgi:hypothetical protein